MVLCFAIHSGWPMERIRSEESAAGIRAPQRFTARMGLRRMGVAPASVVTDGSGHYHLLVDTDLVRTDQPIPSDYNHIHLRKGQTEVVLTLPPGPHTLQFIVGNHAHSLKCLPRLCQRRLLFM